MGKNSYQVQNTNKAVKFGKSASQSSLLTSHSNQFEREIQKHRISDEQKQKLIKFITVENFNMKEAAKKVKMSYSTAKKIFTRFRRTLRIQNEIKSKQHAGLIQSGYLIVEETQQRATQVVVISTIAGIQNSPTQDQIAQL